MLRRVSTLNNVYITKNWNVHTRWKHFIWKILISFKGNEKKRSLIYKNERFSTFGSFVHRENMPRCWDNAFSSDAQMNTLRLVWETSITRRYAARFSRNCCYRLKSHACCCWLYIVLFSVAISKKNPTLLYFFVQWLPYIFTRNVLRKLRAIWNERTKWEV